MIGFIVIMFRYFILFYVRNVNDEGDEDEEYG